MELLVRAGANISKSIIQAVLTRDLHSLRMLCEFGASVDAIDENSLAVLQIAASQNDPELTALLSTVAGVEVAFGTKTALEGSSVKQVRTMEIDGDIHAVDGN